MQQSIRPTASVTDLWADFTELQLSFYQSNRTSTSEKHIYDHPVQRGSYTTHAGVIFTNISSARNEN